MYSQVYARNNAFIFIDLFTLIEVYSCNNTYIILISINFEFTCTIRVNYQSLDVLCKLVNYCFAFVKPQYMDMKFYLTLKAQYDGLDVANIRS